MLSTIKSSALTLAFAGILTTPVFAQQFQRVIGTAQDDLADWIAPTSDGGSILCGRSQALPGFYVAKLNSSGHTEWEKFLRGSGTDIPSRILQTSDNGYCLAGATTSGPIGFGISLIRLDQNGKYCWSQCFEGTAPITEVGLEQTANDDGFILCASSQNSGQASQVGVLIKTNSVGVLQWQKNFWDVRSE